MYFKNQSDIDISTEYFSGYRGYVYRSAQDFLGSYVCKSEDLFLFESVSTYARMNHEGVVWRNTWRNWVTGFVMVTTYSPAQISE